MNLTKKQEKDLETILYFIPEKINKEIITDKDILNFFEYSEKGLHKEKILNYEIDGFNAILQGKRWRGIHMQMWEDGVLSGDIPYAVLLEDMPRNVVDFMKKEMFKGIDSYLIEETYKTLCN